MTRSRTANDTATEPITRLYCLMPDTEVARRVVRELLDNQGCLTRDVHLVASDQSELENLPETDTEDTTDFVPGLARGVAAGGATGLLAGLVAVSVPAAGIALGGGLVLALTGMGAAFGAVVSSMIGASVTHTRIKEFEEAIERGEVLLMVDVKPSSADAVKAAIERTHPAAHVEGTNVDRPSVVSLKE